MWDCRALGESLYTIRQTAGQDRLAAIGALINRLLRTPRDLVQEHDAGSVLFTDALGALPPALPADLQQMQFVSVQPGPDHVPVGLFSARPGSAAGVAQDGPEGPGPRIRAEAPLQPSLRLTVLRGASSFSIDVPAAFVQIDQLLCRLIMQHHAQSPF